MTIQTLEMVKLKYNSKNSVSCRSNNLIAKSNPNPDKWIAFDIEWEVTTAKNNITLLKDCTNANRDKIASGGSKAPVLEEYYSDIVTFGFEDSYGNKGCFDISDFGSQKPFLQAIKEKLLEYQYCFAWGSKAIKRRENNSGKLEGINGDLVVLDSNFRNNGITSIIKYDGFTSIPFIKDTQKNSRLFISDIDLLQVFVKPLVKNVIFKNKYKSLRLDEVGKALLGYGKLDSKTGAKIEEMSIDERKSYCLHDAHIVGELVRINNGDILKIMDVIASHTGLKFEEVCHKGMAGIWKKILDETISKKLDNVGYGNIPITLRKLYSNKKPYLEYWGINYGDEDGEDNEELLEYKENSYYQYIELLEQKLKEKSYDEDEDNNSSNIQLNHKEKGGNLTKQNTERKYKGGTVLSPQRGLHYDVHVFDVTSLYPTMIINHNVSPETVNCFCCKDDFKARAMFDENILKDCLYTSKKDSSSYWICQRKKGLFSKILQDLTEKRKRYKNEGKDIESIAIKAIINSGYGVFGHPHFKYYTN